LSDERVQSSLDREAENVNFFEAGGFDRLVDPRCQVCIKADAVGGFCCHGRLVGWRCVLQLRNNYAAIPPT
jgi:hypothetical protein